MTNHTWTLVSALAGDRVPGVEVSDPECPIDIHDYPEAVEWAEAQGWGNDPNELVYVIPDDGTEVPTGYPTYRIEPDINLSEQTAQHIADELNDWCRQQSGLDVIVDFAEGTVGSEPYQRDQLKPIRLPRWQRVYRIDYEREYDASGIEDDFDDIKRGANE